MRTEARIVWFAVIAFIVLVTVNATIDDDESEMQQARARAKPWLMRTLTVGGSHLHVSPASIITLLLFVLQILYSFVGQRQWCEASHILIKDTSPKTKKAMDAMVKDIAGNARKFGDIAAKYSQCPSKVKNGDLGRFYQGEMAPPFEKVCFDPNSKTGMTLGPVQTQFGYHLIYIRQRKL